TTWKELRAVLDEEVARLPEKLRAPLVLCHLEGLTQEEAARQLGQSKATCRRRLQQARDALAARLVRRGLTLSALLCAALLADGAASACVPAALASSTIKAATLLAAGQAAAAGLISARVAALTRGALTAMPLTKLRLTLVFLFAAAVFGTGLGIFAGPGRTGDDRETKEGQPPMPAARAAEE